MAASIEVMAGPLRCQPRVQHSFPVSGTAQTFVIVELPVEFLLIKWFGWCEWFWKPISTQPASRVIHARPRITNRPFHPPGTVSVEDYFQMDVLPRSRSEDEESVRNYFQMDEWDECTLCEKDGDDGGSNHTVSDSDSDSDDDLAPHDDVLDSNPATHTTRQLVDGATWLDGHADDAPVVPSRKALSVEEVKQFVENYNAHVVADWRVPVLKEPSLHECHSRKTPEWAKTAEGRVRQAAYLRGMSMPDFQPTWAMGATKLGIRHRLRKACPPPLPPPSNAPAPALEPSTSVASGSRKVPATMPAIVLPEKAKADTGVAESWEEVNVEDLLKALENKPQAPAKRREVSNATQANVSCWIARDKPEVKNVKVVELDNTPVVEKHTHEKVRGSEKQKGTPAVEKRKIDNVKGSQKSTSAVAQAVVDVPEVRFQGKIKARKNARVTFGFIEVNEKNLKALREHPLWTSEMEGADVFWHCSDCRHDAAFNCKYDVQFAGDIVTFTVMLKPEGSCLQAKHIDLKRRAWQ